MRFDYPGPFVLHGSLVTSFSSDEFFAFCQDNPDLCIERNAKGKSRL